MKKYDLHLHSHLSNDCLNKPGDLVRKYHELGFDGFAITDHSKFGVHKSAREFAKRKGIEIEIIPACEFKCDRGEVIGLYLQEMIEKKDFESLCDEIHDQGGFVILPHPFDSYRKGATRPDLFSKDDLRFIDAIETINGHSLLDSDNQKSEDFANLNSLAKTGGSDAHLLSECGSAYTLFEKDLELEIALRKKKTLAGGKTIPFYTRGFPTLIRLAKKFGLV